MAQNTCICCGETIPEGRQICKACDDVSNMQSAKPMKYFRIIDDCGWTYYIATDRTDLLAANIVLLVPHVRSAAEISRIEYERRIT